MGHAIKSNVIRKTTFNFLKIRTKILTNCTSIFKCEMLRNI